MYVSIDTETSGLIPSKHRLLSVAVAFMEDNFMPSDGKIFYISDDIGEIDPKAMEVNNIDLEWLAKNGLPLKEVEQNVCEYIQDAHAGRGTLKPVGQNIAFDIDRWIFNKMPELALTINRCFDYRRQDTQIIAGFLKRTGYKQPHSTSLKSLSDFYGIQHAAHNALSDCQACLAVYKCQVKSFTKKWW